MESIIIAGAGNIGSRHLQGLSTMSSPTRIYVIDPAAESRERAADRWDTMDCDTHQVSYHDSFTELAEDTVSLAIISTPASVRRAVFEDLLDAAAVRNVVFEKVLFQRVADYEAVETLLSTNDIDAWVNCPRRMYEVYQQIDAELDVGSLDLEIMGSAWQMGCNTIHFADLFGWLTDTWEFSWDTSLLEDRLLESPRAGVVEFCGRLTARNAQGDTLTLRSFPTGPTNLSVRISTPSTQWVVNETAGEVFQTHYQENGVASSDRFDFSIPYQSQLSGHFATAILDDGTPRLPTYAESSVIHRPLIDAFIAHANNVSGEHYDRCPIT